MIKQLLIKGKNVSYTLEGEGQVIVLLHGFGEDSTIWQQQINFLSKKYCVLAPDFAGSGQSTFYEGISIESMANDIYEILDAEGITKVCMLGHSMGGYVTLAFAEAFPHLLKSFGLVHSIATADSDEKKEARKKGIAFVQQHGAFAFLKTMIPKLFMGQFILTNPAYIEAYTTLLHSFSAQSVIGYYEAMMTRVDRTNILSQSQVPVMIVLGEKDQIIPVDDGVKQAALPHLASLHILDNVGHMGMVEKPNELNDCISRFLLL